MERVSGGVKGKDRNGNFFAIMWSQIENIEKKPFGCLVRLDTGEGIPISMGYERAKIFFRP